MIRSPSIATLLNTALAVLALLFCASMAGALGALVRSNASLTTVGAEIAVQQDLADAVHHTRASRVWLVQASVYGSYGMFKESADALQTARQRLEDSRQAFGRYWAAPRPAEEDALAQVLQGHYERFVAEGLEPLLQALQNGNPQAYINTLRNKTPALDAALAQQVQTVLEARRTRTAALEQGIAAAFERNAALLGLAALGFAAVAALLAWGARRSLVRPLQTMADAVDAVADNDLARPAPRAPRFEPREMAHMRAGLARMRERLADTVGAIRHAADTVQQTSHHLAQGHADLAERTQEQTGQLQQALAAITDMTRALADTTQAAERVAQASSSAAQAAQAGGQRMADAGEAMDAIDTSSRRIGDITAVIDGLAFQTNILALNAAVEAARAGEQGRGFAVVASEVRHLAQRSAEAAREIRSLIDSARSCVQRGVTEVRDASGAMEQLLAQVHAAAQQAADIQASVRSQAQEIQAAQALLAGVDRSTLDNARLVHAGAEAAHSLDAQAETLARSVHSFRLPEAAGRATPRAPLPAAARPLALA